MANEISLETVLRQCGDLHRYQVINYIFLTLITIGSGITTYYYVFGVAEPLYRCQLPQNIWLDDEQYVARNRTHQDLIDRYQSTGKCENSNGSICRNFLYDRSVFGRTFTEEGDFICEKSLTKTWLSTLYQVGG